jgi:hypothetical protein
LKSFDIQIIQEFSRDYLDTQWSVTDRNANACRGERVGGTIALAAFRIHREWRKDDGFTSFSGLSFLALGHAKGQKKHSQKW